MKKSIYYISCDEFNYSDMYNRSFRQLIVWKNAEELTLEIYRFTKLFLSEEKYGLSSQLRRAASSIMANIAEGNERLSYKDRLRFLWISDKLV